MQVTMLSWTVDGGWKGTEHQDGVHLVLYFAAPKALQSLCPYQHLSAAFPGAHVVGCSTGGEILADEVVDDSIAGMAIRFDSSHVVVATIGIDAAAQSQSVGAALAARLPLEGLRNVLVLADGMRTNGTALVAGLREVLPESVLLTGGLAGDGADFRKTLVGCDAAPGEGVIAAIGFYGEALRLGWGSIGGWDRFGPERRITRAVDNVLYELDGEPALDLYKRYLGEEADKLPGSALLFPLTVRKPSEENSSIVRTIVGIDEEKRSMIFAGDVPEGYIAQLMRGHFDELVDGASRAAELAAEAQGHGEYVALLVSCIGRKLLMGQRIADEVEVAGQSLGDDARVAGFYSYGEIAPHGFTGRCELHNQTMTVTTIGEVDA